MPSWMGGLVVAGLASAGVASLLARRHADSPAIGLGLLVQAAALLFVIAAKAWADPAGQVMAMLTLSTLPLSVVLLALRRSAQPRDEAKVPSPGDPQR
jgi:NADH:ubiquinone oxidoreductase subunit K